MIEDHSGAGGSARSRTRAAGRGAHEGLIFHDKVLGICAQLGRCGKTMTFKSQPPGSSPAASSLASGHFLFLFGSFNLLQGSTVHTQYINILPLIKPEVRQQRWGEMDRVTCAFAQTSPPLAISGSQHGPWIWLVFLSHNVNEKVLKNTFQMVSDSKRNNVRI